ncbi:DUF397 domain-containing protein [Streptomyces sp. SP2-10]|uniref:DUF397 domain-containing protein n=1 Tax=Streptomyces sp. SP2-10 TaxID=2873385 RepID=UPI001CA636ED|nr:DUF397 domain-containing protein [Streptomyces sp. SP2-10]MBY8846862.1 DUF397 domain-containing protein [Streptomyces sp. SP2-10]
MREYDLSGARRRRSTRRNGDGGNCVEVADKAPGVVPVRDSEVADGTVTRAGAVARAGAVVRVGAAAWVVVVRGTVG